MKKNPETSSAVEVVSAENAMAELQKELDQQAEKTRERLERANLRFGHKPLER